MLLHFCCLCNVGPLYLYKQYVSSLLHVADPWVCHDGMIRGYRVSLRLFFSFCLQKTHNALVFLHLKCSVRTQTGCVHLCRDNRYLLYKQFLAHGDALIEPLLVFLQEFLLFIYLSPQVTVSLFKKDGRDIVKCSCVVIIILKTEWHNNPTFVLLYTIHQNYQCPTHPEQVIYSPLFLLQVQTLVTLQSSEFQAG